MEYKAVVCFVFCGIDIPSTGSRQAYISKKIRILKTDRDLECGQDKAIESIPKPLSTVIGCKAHGSALSAKKVLNVPQHDSEPFLPPALTMDFSLDLVTKQVLG